MRKALRIAIIRKFDNQSDFAQNAGLRESLVSRIIRNRHEPDSITIKKIANTLNLKEQAICKMLKEI